MPIPKIRLSNEDVLSYHKALSEFNGSRWSERVLSENPGLVKVLAEIADFHASGNKTMRDKIGQALAHLIFFLEFYDEVMAKRLLEE